MTRLEDPMRDKICRRVGAVLVIFATMMGSGCSTNWIGQVREIVSVMIPAATNLVTLAAALQGKSAAAGDLSTIQNAGTQAAADLQVVEALISAYESADETAKPGILNQIQSAIGAAQGNLQGLMLGLHIKDAATQGKIVAIVGLLQSEVQSLAALVPVVQGQGSGVGSQGAVARVALRRKAPLSANDFVKSYNSVLTAKSGNAELDQATVGLAIHLHSKVERVASAWVLK